MKRTPLAILISLSALAGSAYAQSDTGVTMSTDPQRAADVEQHAQDLQSSQSSQQMSTQSTEQTPTRQHHPKMRHHHKQSSSDAS